MAKKKTADKPPREEVFRSNAFSALKGVAVALPTPKSDCKPAVVAKQPAVEPLDENLFLEAMSDVRPLIKRAPAAKQAAAQKQTPVPSASFSERKAAIDKNEADAFATAISQLKLDVTFSDRFPENDEIKSLGANRLRQLKKGVITVNRQLDLHGLTREEALDALPRFLRSASDYGEKAVLVITGKGLNSPGEPVLQQAVAGWLRESGKKLVLEFAPAPRDMGGQGAFVVFLRG